MATLRPKNLPERSQSNQLDVRQTRSRNRAAFVRTLLLGFGLGVCCTITVQLLFHSHEAMGVSVDAHSKAEMELSMPQQHPEQHQHTQHESERNLKGKQSTAATTTARTTAATTRKKPPTTTTTTSTTTTKKPPTTTAKTTTTATTTTPKPTTTTTRKNAAAVSTDQINNPKQPNLVPFQKQEGVVIATKIHSIYHWDSVKQSLCLLQYAYNSRPNYDILVFTTLPIPQKDIEEARQLVHPAKFTVAMDNPGMSKLIRSFTKLEQEHLLERCNVTSIEQMDWDITCHEPNKDGKWEKLAYNWQAEFRSLHIWNHEALMPYKRMMWLDTDAFCTRIWTQDPIVHAIQNNLAIFFMNFPQGRSSGDDFRNKTREAFGDAVCDVNMADGHLTTRLGKCIHLVLRNVHGFFHITDLEFYRSKPVMKWTRTLIGDTHFYRRYDDQVAVTVPAAVLAPNRSWHMTDHGYYLDVFHNSLLDGKRWPGAGGFKTWWARYGKGNFTTADGICPITIAT